MSKSKSTSEGRTMATDLARPGGKILAGGFSPRLCQRLTECVAAMAALEKISSPIVPYIAAWREHEKIIWYEYVGARFLALLGCDRGEVDEVFRQSIVDRRLYRYADRESRVKEEIVTRAELRGDRAGLREQVAKLAPVFGEDVLQISFSAGLTEHRSGECVNQTLERADRLLYDAKAQGRNRVVTG